MNSTLKHILTLAAIPLILLVLYGGYSWLSAENVPPPPDFDYLELQVVESVMMQAAGKIKRNENYTSVLCDIVADKKNASFEMLRSKMQGKYNLDKPKVDEDVEKQGVEAVKAFVADLLKKEEKRPTLTVWLKVIDAEDAISAQMDVSLRMPGEAKPRKLGPFTRSYHKSFSNLDYLGYTIQQTSAWARLFMWLLVALLLPIVTAPIIRKVVIREKNSHNVALLAGYTFIVALLGFILKGFSLGNFFGFVLYLAGLVGAFLWITIVANKIDEWRK